MTRNVQFLQARQLAPLLALIFLGQGTPAEKDTGHPDGYIFANAEAARLFAEARKYDPMFAQENQRDRERAVELYAQAIVAQPGAKMNGPIADRIAQMYAFNTDETRGIGPQREKANEWWLRCLEFTNDRQLLWGQAQMGLAGAARYQKIIEMDPARLELPDWKDWSKTSQDAKDAELARLRTNLDNMRIRASEHLFRIQANMLRAEMPTAQTAPPATRENVAAQPTSPTPSLPNKPVKFDPPPPAQTHADFYRNMGFATGITLGIAALGLTLALRKRSRKTKP